MTKGCAQRILALASAMVLSLQGSLYAQDPVFSQFYAAPLNLNPAFTGNTEGGQVALNYRNQWPGISQAYVTYAASYDQFFPWINSGFGLAVLADNAGNGLYKTINAQLSYAYKARFNGDLQMRMGIQAGLINSRIDWSQLVFLDQLDPEFGLSSPGGIPFPSDEVPPAVGSSVSVLDVSAGLLLYNRNYYVGISLKHLNEPKFSFLEVNQNQNAGLPIQFAIHGGAEIDLRKLGGLRNSFLAPNIQYIRQGAFSQLNIGTIFRYYKVGTGVWFRQTNTNPDAVIFLVEGRYDQFRIGYSYDLTLSSLNGTGGAHEISVIMNFDSGRKESKYNDCFNLFR
ncbi:MAG: type IX secretion system membrane protein PorP/SprF [Saprospiraceae bacterium]|nr:type IX secretion system membrane protein PorP/SprF [Saprospiraceae bacterium]